MAVSNVELRVDARQAVGALREANKAAGQVSVSAEKLTQAVNRSNVALSRTSNNAGRAGSAFKNLASSVGRLAAAYLSLQTAQRAIETGIQREESTRRLTFLAKGYNEIAQAQAAAARTGRQFGLSATESNQQFAQLYGRLRPLNVTLEDIEAAFVGFNTAAKVSGATTAESAGALLQLTQALGSGVLRGQELNSVLEQAPGLVVALTRELNTPVSEIRKLAEEGQITSDVVIRALKRAGTDGAGQLEEALQGPAQQIKNLQNAFEDFQVAVSKDILPVVIKVIQELTKALQDGTQNVENIGLAFEYVAGKLAPLLNGLQQLQWYFTNLTPPGWAMQVISGSSNVAGGLIRGVATRQRIETNPVLAGGRYLAPGDQVNFMAPPSRPPLSGGGGGGGGRGAAREAERAAEALKRSVERGDELYRQYSRQAALLGDMNEIDRKRLQITYDYQDRATEIAELKNVEQRVNLTALNDEIKRLQLLELQTEERKKQLDLFYQLAGFSGTPELLGGGAGAFMLGITLDPGNEAQNKINELKTQLETLQNPINLAQSGAQSIADAFSSTFSGIISGAQSAQEALATFFQNVANSFLNMATEIIAKMIQMYVLKSLLNLFGGGGSIFGAAGAPNYSGVFGAGSAGLPGFTPGLNLLPQRAMGGSVSGGQPYLVGERGPELFMPGRSGGIAPTGSFGGGVNVVVNVDASGTSVQGDQSQGAALGRVVAAAVQAELIKQKRPGGLLTT